MPSQSQQQERGLLERGAIHGIQELFKKEGLEFTASDLPAIANFKPEKSPFPILIFLLAVTKDIVDLFVIFPDLAGLTVIGIIFTVSVRMLVLAFTIIVTTVFWLWMIGKISGLARFGMRGAVKLYVRRRVQQGTAGFFVECIAPYIPFTTIFVILAHHHENKYVKLFIEASEQYGRALKGKGIKFGNSQPRQRQPTSSNTGGVQRVSEFARGATSRTQGMSTTVGSALAPQHTATSLSTLGQSRGSLPPTRTTQALLPEAPPSQTPASSQTPRTEPHQDIGAQPLFRQAPPESVKK
ncbi:MAG: hypothetical protein Q7R64_00850 [bacterium]|nr:hypothetical protein [bacterium]